MIGGPAGPTWLAARALGATARLLIDTQGLRPDTQGFDQDTQGSWRDAQGVAAAASRPIPPEGAEGPT